MKSVRMMLVVMVATLALCGTAGATALTWDATPGSGAADEGAGTWTNGAGGWWNGAANVNWNNATPDQATFGVGGAGTNPYTVTLGGAITAGKLTFNAGAVYTLGGTNALTLSTPGNSEMLVDNVGSTINCPITSGGAAKTWTIASGKTLTVNYLRVANNSLNVTGTLNGTTLRVDSGAWFAGSFHSDNTSTTAGSYAFEFVSNTNGGAVSANLSGAGNLRFNLDGGNVTSLTGTNTYTGKTLLVTGAMKAGSSALPSNSLLEFAATNWVVYAPITTGETTFARTLGDAAGNVKWSGSGGFSSTNGNVLHVNLTVGGVSGGEVTWGSGGFVPTGSNLQFNYANWLDSTVGNAMVDFQNPINLNGATRTVVARGNVTRLSGTIRNGNLTAGLYSTTAVLELTGDNSAYDGSIAVSDTTSNGKLRITSAGSSTFGTAASSITVANGYALELAGGVTVRSGSLTFSGNGTGVSNDGFLRSSTGANTVSGSVSVSGVGTANTRIFVDTGSTLTVNGVVSGSSTGGLTKTGAGTLELATDNTYGGTSGGTTVSAGTLILDGSNGYKGATSVSASAVLRIKNSNALGSASQSATTTVASGGALDIQGGSGSVSVPSVKSLSIAGAGISNAGAIHSISGANSLGGTVAMTASSTIGVDAGSLTLNGALSGSGFNLTKVGDGILELASTNSYSGTTAVSAGTLKVSGTLSNSAVSVASGAKLTGAGSVRATTVNGIVAPGNSPGVLTVNGAYTMNDGSTYEWELASLTSYDRIDVTGNLNLTTLPSTWTLKILDGGFDTDDFISPTAKIDLFTYTGILASSFDTVDTAWLTSVNIALGSGLDPLVWKITAATKVKYDEGGSYKRVYLTGLQVGSSGGAVPEPAAIGLLGLVLLAIRKRRAA